MTFHQPPYPDADNGNMPSTDLTAVGSGLQLQKDVAAAWNAEVARGAAAGVSLTIPAGGAYRDYAAQLALYDSSRTGIAVPGTSTHGYGTCVDINTNSANNWAIANFEPSLWVRDLWHPITNGSPTPPDYLHEWNHWHYTGAIGGTTQPVGTSNIVGKRHMWLAFDTGGTGYLITESGTTAVSLPEYNLLWRVIVSNQQTSPFAGGTKPEVFAPGEFPMIQAAIRRTMA